MGSRKDFADPAVVTAMFKDLKRNHGLGSSNGEELVILHGGSSGAHGAMHHLDRVKGYLGLSNVHVVGAHMYAGPVGRRIVLVFMLLIKLVFCLIL